MTPDFQEAPISQIPALRLLQQLGFSYLSPEEAAGERKGCLRVLLEGVPTCHRFAAILATADQELTLLRTQRQTLDQQKRGLMRRLLTGKCGSESLDMRSFPAIDRLKSDLDPHLSLDGSKSSELRNPERFYHLVEDAVRESFRPYFGSLKLPWGEET